MRCPISEFLGWESSYQQCWLPFRDFEFVIKRHGLPKFKDLVSFHKTVVCVKILYRQNFVGLK